MTNAENGNTPHEELSTEALLQGVAAHYERKADIDLKFVDSGDLSAIGVSTEELLKEGLRYMMIVHKVYAPFFLSESIEIQAGRNDFFADKGEYKFYKNQRTGEVVVFLK